MKIRILLASLILSLAGTSATYAQAPKEDQTELGAHMDKISGAFRKLRTSAKDATQNEASLAQVAIIKDNATAALKLEPALKKDKPAEEQAKFSADYVAKMKSFLADVDALEAALKAGKNDEAAALVDKLGADQKEGHKQFKKSAPKKQ
jgi:cytochrome c556